MKIKKFLDREVYGTVSDFLKTAVCDFTTGFVVAVFILLNVPCGGKTYYSVGVAAWIMIIISTLLIATKRR
jgi:hypothetical protein